MLLLHLMVFFLRSLVVLSFLICFAETSFAAQSFDLPTKMYPFTEGQAQEDANAICKEKTGADTTVALHWTVRDGFFVHVHCEGDIASLPEPDSRFALYTDALIGHSLWLRPMFPDDGKAFVKSYGDPTFMQYFGSGRTYAPQQVEANGKVWALKSKNCSRDEWQRWAILGPNGVLGYVSVAWNKEEGALELSYCNVSEPKRGCVTEAARLVIDSTGKSFFATCHPDNRASCAVLEKLGFIKDPKRQNVPQYGATRNYYLLPQGE